MKKFSHRCRTVPPPPPATRGPGDFPALPVEGELPAAIQVCSNQIEESENHQEKLMNLNELYYLEQAFKGSHDKNKHQMKSENRST